MPEFSLFNTRIHDHGHAYSYDTFTVSRRLWQTHGAPPRARRRRSAQPLAEGVALRILPVGKAVGHAPADNRRRGGRRGKVQCSCRDLPCVSSSCASIWQQYTIPARPSQHRFIRGLSPGVSQRLFSHQRLFKKTLRARGVCRIYLTYTLKRPRYLEDARSILVGSVSYFARREQPARRFLGSVPRGSPRGSGSVPAIPALSLRPSGSAAARSSG